MTDPTYAEIRDLAMLDLVSDPRQVVYAADVEIERLTQHWHREEKNANLTDRALENQRNNNLALCERVERAEAQLEECKFRGKQLLEDRNALRAKLAEYRGEK